MNDTMVRTFDPRAFLARNEEIRAQADALDVSHTETVTVGDLRVGDVILALGGDGCGVVFPFPFTLSRVSVFRRRSAVLTASHGWFTPVALPVSERAVRVA